MSYFNSNSNLYPTPADGEFDMYSFLNQPPAPEQADDQVYPMFPNYWETAGAPTNLGATAGYESMALATSHVPHVDSASHPSFMNQRWPGFEDQSQVAGPSSWATSTTTSEASTALEAPSSFPLDFWGHNQSASPKNQWYPLPDPVDTISEQDPYSSCRQRVGPARTDRIPGERFQPYVTARARTVGYTNAEAGPSTLAPPPVPRARSPTPQPSGGISETTAVAEPTQTITEEAEAPRQESRLDRLPHGQGAPRKYRVEAQRELPKLYEWVLRHNDQVEPKNVCEALAIAVEAIKAIRPVLMDEPYLVKIPTKAEDANTAAARRERNRRAAERGLYEELSRRYPPGPKPWTRAELLALVVLDLEGNPILQ